MSVGNDLGKQIYMDFNTNYTHQAKYCERKVVPVHQLWRAILVLNNTHSYPKRRSFSPNQSYDDLS